MQVTFAMKSFLARLWYWGSSRLRDYEQLCLDCFKTELPAEERSILDHQINLIQLIQRLSKDKMVTIWFLENEKKTGFPLFPNRSKEISVARVTIRSGSSNLRCDIQFDEGCLLSLQFDVPPKFALGQPAQCVKVEIYEDLFQHPAENQILEEVTPVLDRIKALFPVREIAGPAPAEKRQRFLGRLATSLPQDYTQLLSETDGFTVQDWRFYGTKPRRIVHDKENYQLVVENDPFSLCFRENQDLPVVLFYDQIDDEISQMGESFVDALIKILNKKPADAGTGPG